MHNVLVTICRPATRSEKRFLVERNLFMKAGRKTVRMMNKREFKEFIVDPLRQHFSHLMINGWYEFRVRLCTYGMVVDNEENRISV